MFRFSVIKLCLLPSEKYALTPFASLSAPSIIAASFPSRRGASLSSDIVSDEEPFPVSAVSLSVVTLLSVAVLSLSVVETISVSDESFSVRASLTEQDVLSVFSVLVSVTSVTVRSLDVASVAVFAAPLSVFAPQEAKTLTSMIDARSNDKREFIFFIILKTPFTNGSYQGKKSAPLSFSIASV